jgi:Protein of unknown function (DUF2505)
MDFRIDQTIAAPLAAVERALLDRDFIDSTSVLPKLGAPEVLELNVDGDSARSRVRYRFTAELSHAVTRVIDPKNLTWVDDASWDLRAHHARHRIVPDHYGDRLEASYDVTLSAQDDGTRRVVTGVLKVHVPLVGGKVEHAIVDGLKEHADEEAKLLARWVSHAGS